MQAKSELSGTATACFAVAQAPGMPRNARPAGDPPMVRADQHDGELPAGELAPQATPNAPVSGGESAKWESRDNLTATGGEPRER
ncbi:hypothetical protein [Actinokineospora sp. NBRC 105648]|uniref:hypothetical protein n=1 Tax=Actinokineospora sp. NBRC 105648 TaxID=3032206 RepID=UPI0024A45CBD|nr:hypothetical protein [Actinokineospora sp. NBRC 105648]GLZ43586.1 hypothetical protein Acsp05_72100 [Actinokineospora sp. NBRC 105648]